MIYYVVYKGDEFMCVGTAQECADFMGKSLASIKRYATPSKIASDTRIKVYRVHVGEDEMDTKTKTISRECRRCEHARTVRENGQEQIVCKKTLCLWHENRVSRHQYGYEFEV